MEINEYLGLIGDWIGYIGVIIVIIGVIGSFLKFLYYAPSGHTEREFSLVRHFLMLYLTVGLDFLIAKDIILTLAVETMGYESLIELFLIVAIRIILSYFIHMEEKYLEKIHSRTRVQRKKKK